MRKLPRIEDSGKQSRQRSLHSFRLTQGVPSFGKLSLIPRLDQVPSLGFHHPLGLLKTALTTLGPHCVETGVQPLERPLWN